MITMSHSVERIKLKETVLLVTSFEMHIFIQENDCSSAYDIQKGILHNGDPNNVKVSVAETDKSASQMSESKIRNNYSYHSVSFNECSMTFWQYFSCVNGRNVDYSNLTFKSGLFVLVPFKKVQ